MAPQLSTTTSIVDFLKSRGEESSFTARRKLFTEKGFATRLGEFTGSASQNLALLRNLRTPTEVTAPPAVTEAVPTTEPAGAAAIETAGAPVTPPTAPPSFTEQIKERVPTAGEQFDLTQIPTPEAPTPGDILERARGETGVQLAQKEQAFAAGRLPAQVEQGITDVRSDFASRGLVFSGARTTAEQGVRDKAIADKFNIDLRFAKVLGGAIDRAATDLGKDIEEVIKDARDQRQEEIDFLADLGLAVNPQTGELFETLQSLRERRIAEAELTPRTQARSIGGRELLIDLNTGDVIRDLGPSKISGIGPEGLPEFSRSEQLKLEEAGLTDAPRDEQLDLLFGEGAEVTKQEKRDQQFEDARAIAVANIEEKIFGKTGKLKKDVTREELENSIRQVTGLGIGDVRRIIDEVLAIKDIGEQ